MLDKFEPREVKAPPTSMPGMVPGQPLELENLIYDQSGRVGRITFNRRDARNAINMAMLQELQSVLHRLDWESEVRVIIIRGGGAGFSSGYDIDDVAQREDMTNHQNMLRNDVVLQVYNEIRNCKMATIAQVHGYCLSGATDLAHQADMVIVSSDCQIGYPNMRCWGTGLACMWLYHMGPQWAKYLMMTGDTIDGELAEKIGFAIKSVPEAKLEKTVLHVAERIAGVDKMNLWAHKMMVNQGVDLMGWLSLQQYGLVSDAITHQTDASIRNFDRTLGMGIRAYIKASTQGLEPQKGPFEPLD